jgi:hypothetical protein
VDGLLNAGGNCVINLHKAVNTAAFGNPFFCGILAVSVYYLHSLSDIG